MQCSSISNSSGSLFLDTNKSVGDLLKVFDKISMVFEFLVAHGPAKRPKNR